MPNDLEFRWAAYNFVTHEELFNIFNFVTVFFRNLRTKLVSIPHPFSLKVKIKHPAVT